MELTIVYLALADSVNPCTLAIMALLLLTILRKRGRKDAVIAGLLFTTTVFVMYTLYGLGVLSFLLGTGLMDVLRSILFFLVLVLFLWELKAFLFYSPGFSSLEMPKFLRPFAKRVVSSAENPLTAVPIAVLCSIFLLPCSSGPYLVALGMVEGIADVLLYNLIFVAPMLLVTLLVGLGVSPEKISSWRNRHVRLLHLVSALLLLWVLLYLSPPVQVSNGSGLLLVEDPMCPHCKNLKRYLNEMGIAYTVIDRATAHSILSERNVRWDGGVPLLIGEDFVLYGFPSASQEVNGFFPNEENLCKLIGGTPVYSCDKYQYCVLPNGMILGNKRVLEYIKEGELR